MMLLRQTRSLLSRRTFASVPETMKAAVVRVVGDADALEVGDYPTPSVGEGQVLVKNEFAGINFIDTYHRGGLYPRDLPFIGAPTPLPAALLRSQRGRCSAPGLRA